MRFNLFHSFHSIERENLNEGMILLFDVIVNFPPLKGFDVRAAPLTQISYPATIVGFTNENLKNFDVMKLKKKKRHKFSSFHWEIHLSELFFIVFLEFYFLSCVWWKMLEALKRRVIEVLEMKINGTMRNLWLIVNFFLMSFWRFKDSDNFVFDENIWNCVLRLYLSFEVKNF